MASLVHGNDDSSAIMPLLIRDSHSDDVPAIAAIYGHSVLHDNASFEIDPPDATEIGRRRDALLGAGFPYLVAENEAGRVVGYSSAGTYRPRPGYRFTVENSVYVAPDCQGQGIGLTLLPRLIERCEAGGVSVDGGSDRQFRKPRLDPTARSLRVPARGPAAGDRLEARKLAGLGADDTAARAGRERTALSGSPAPDYAASANCPLIVRPCDPADTCTVSPSFTAPSRISDASGFCSAALDHPLQRPRAVGAVVALARQPLERAAIQLQPDLAIGQQLAQVLQLDLHDRRHVAALQPAEQDDLVQPVEELGPEVLRAPRVITWPCTIAVGSPSGCAASTSLPRLEVSTMMRVLEVHRAALAVGQPAVVQHLQQHVEHVLMRLLDLVEQDHLIRPPAHRLGQHAALVVADIARRRADQPRTRRASP